MAEGYSWRLDAEEIAYSIGIILATWLFRAAPGASRPITKVPWDSILNHGNARIAKGLTDNKLYY